jgi:hypothetical protein
VSQFHCTTNAHHTPTHSFCLVIYRLQIQSIVRLVVRRSARMAAVLLVAVLRLQGWQEQPRRLVVAVDGGVFLKYHNWRKFLDTYLREAFGGFLGLQCGLDVMYSVCNKWLAQCDLASPSTAASCPFIPCPFLLLMMDSH